LTWAAHNGGTTLDGARHCAPPLCVRSMEWLGRSFSEATASLHRPPTVLDATGLWQRTWHEVGCLTGERAPCIELDFSANPVEGACDSAALRKPTLRKPRQCHAFCLKPVPWLERTRVFASCVRRGRTASSEQRSRVIFADRHDRLADRCAGGPRRSWKDCRPRSKRPNVWHEGRPQASEACLWTSPRWKG